MAGDKVAIKLMRSLTGLRAERFTFYCNPSLKSGLDCRSCERQDYDLITHCKRLHLWLMIHTRELMGRQWPRLRCSPFLLFGRERERERQRRVQQNQENISLLPVETLAEFTCFIIPIDSLSFTKHVYDLVCLIYPIIIPKIKALTTFLMIWSFW